MSFQNTRAIGLNDFKSILSDAQFESDQMSINVQEVGNHLPKKYLVERIQPIIQQKKTYIDEKTPHSQLKPRVNEQKSYHQPNNDIHYDSRQHQHQTNFNNINYKTNQMGGGQQRQVRFVRGTNRNSRLSHPTKPGMMRKNSSSNTSMSRRVEDYDLEGRYLQMRERLKNLHYFYKIRIKQQKMRTAQRNQFFMNMIQQMQQKHNEQIANYRRLIMQCDQQQKEVGMVDDRMNTIKSSVEDILKKSSELKGSNTEMERLIGRKESVIRSKETEADKLKEQLNRIRNKMELTERERLKQNKRNKEMLQMINNSQLQ